jgi:hypothetical protein
MKYLFVGLAFIFVACNAPAEVSAGADENDRVQAVEAKARDFFETYAERSDWEKLLSFYRNDLIFEDVLLQLQLDSLWQFERFYNWPDTNFRKLHPGQPSLEVEHLLVDDSTAIATGYFTPFYWYGQLIEPEWGMQFQMVLHFDEDLRIKKQVDWIEYDDTVLESVIKRYREVGVDDPPAWLDLEPN